ncbi:SH3 domain-containing protein [Tamlana haliotis]|uniref:SH3 domain-containing protein n=1 Tax=Pseudotamlana haliotis TaxID=2614804 RepID=A0A6N6MG71_9FLAO|nr:SH3 domain-containing protein [Tamlana haliotis]KAB1069301.1 SH3 domain-containing protein [Tamlana haliotis]
MKKTLLITLFLLTSMVSFSQSYLGWITKQVNFREGPSTEYSVVKSLKPGTQIFIVSTNAENNYLNIIDIETNKEGYVHKSYIKLGDIVEKNESGIFTPSGKSTTYKPEIEIYNNTDITLTLKLNSKLFTFNPHEKQTISLSPGTYSYRASAPGVIPNIGTENMESNMNYSWQFYIVTERR